MNLYVKSNGWQRKERKLFPTDGSTEKVIYLAVQDAFKKWAMPIKKQKVSIESFYR